MLDVAFRRAARAEFDEAAAWYEAKRADLGLDFIAEVERCVHLAAEHPEHYMTVYRDVRRVVTRYFPFSIYFRAESRRIVVLAVFHGSRDPAVWQSRN